MPKPTTERQEYALMTYSDLSQLIRSKKGAHSGVTFVTKQKEEFYTYGELLERAEGVLYVLQERGLHAGDELIFQLEDNYQFISFFWACLLGGIIPVPITSGNNKEHRLKLLRIYETLKRPHLVTTQDTFERIEQFCLEEQRLGTLESIRSKLVLVEEGAEPAGRGKIHAVGPNDTAMIQFSSGSTGSPKGVILTHDNLICNIKAILSGAEVTPADSCLSWMPLTHDMGLIGSHLSSLAANISLYLMPSALFVFDPGLWIQKTHQHRITILSSPNFGYRHFLEHYKPDPSESWDLSSVRIIFNGAEPISAAWSDRFLRELKPYGLRENVMFPVYGMAEASLAVTFPPPDEQLIPVHLDRSRMLEGRVVQECDSAGEDCITFVDVGYPVQDCLIRICDDDGCILPEQVIGNIQIKGRNVTAGYYENPEETSKLITKDGWLHTGDMGFVRNQRLVVTGRKKDIIFVRGQNYYPHDLEEIAQGLAGIEFGKVAISGIPNVKTGMDEIVVFTVFRGKTEKFMDTAMELRKWLNKSAGVDVAQVIPVKTIPKTTSGKLQRFKLVESYERGEFTNVLQEMQFLWDERMKERTAASPANPREEQLLTLWKQVLGLKHIGTEDDFFELGGDSLKAALLLHQVQKQFDVEVPVKHLYQVSTIKKLADYMEHADVRAFQPITPTEARSYYPISSAQYRVYVQEQMSGVGASYHIPFVIHISGVPDMPLIQKTLEQIMQRHDILRTSFAEVEGKLVQIIHKHVELELEIMQVEAAKLPAVIERLIRPFDLHRAPLFRAGLFTCAYNEHYLILDMHHTITDGISIRNLTEQFIDALQGKELVRPDLQYVDYVLWYEQKKHAASMQLHKEYWLQQLSGELPLLEIPTDYKREDIRTFAGSTVSFQISQDVAAKLQGIAAQNEITLNTVLVSVYGFLLSAYTQQKELIIGSLISGRNHADLTSMLGMFVNYIPLRIHIESDLSWTEFLRESGRTISDAYEHQDYPYEEMIADLAITTPPGRNPLFDTMLILHNQMEWGQRIRVGELELSFEEWKTNTSKLDCKLDIYASSTEGLLGVLEYNVKLYKKETIEAFTQHFCTILHQVAANPQIQLREITITSEKEREQLLRFNDTSCDYPQEMLLHQWFEAQAELRPEQPAVLFEDQHLTYGELNSRANQLAHTLKDRGLGPNRIAAIAVERSPEMIVGILAILKAGAAYMPISPDYPQERIDFMLEDSQAELVLTRHPWKQLFARAGKTTIIDLDDHASYQGDSNPVVVENTSQDAAYVIYTSGSTGKPKGVIVEHSAVVNRIHWMQKQYPLGAEDVILQKTPFTFDVSVWELFWWCVAGSTVCFLEPGGEKDPAAIVQAIAKHRVTTLHFVPSMLHLFLHELEHQRELSGELLSDRLRSIRYVFASGEALSIQHVERFYQVFDSQAETRPRLINLYGPTEAAIDVTYFECEPGAELDRVPIGRPIDNIQLYIVDSENRLQPIGHPGELCIAGVGLARGYLHRPELTEERFTNNPFEPGTRMYRTGDLAKWLPDGTIEYLGRLDHQVKLRGYRIELAEIEDALLSHEDIAEAVVILKEAPDGDKQLHAFMAANREVAAPTIRQHLALLLPEYMLPAFYTQLETMPLTSSGKVDRKALTLMEGTMSLDRSYTAPRNELEAQLVEMWKELLHLEHVGTQEHFFEIGGHSLKATQLLHRLHQQFQADIALRDLFRNPTIQQLAEVLSLAEQSRYEPIPLAEGQACYPLSSAQNRLYILEQLEGIGSTYHLPIALMIEGDVDDFRLEQAWQALLARHEILRTSIDVVDGVPMQRIHPQVDSSIERIESHGEALEELISAFIRPFDLSQAPLLRMGVVQLPHHRQLLLFDMHHIISDGISMGILAQEWVQLYERRELPELKLQYKDFAKWQPDYLASEPMQKQRQYWLDKLAQDIPLLNLPTDFARPSLKSYEGDRLVFHLNAEETQRCKALATEWNATLYMVLLAVFNIVLSKYSSQEDVIVGSPVSGRPHADLHHSIGMFVNTIALRNHCSKHLSFSQFLEQLRDTTLEAFQHQHYPFEELITSLKLTRDLSRNPLFDVMFVMQNMEIPELTMDQRSSKPIAFHNRTSKFDLTLEVTETEEGMTCHLEYGTPLFLRETMERLSQHFRSIMRTVVENPFVRISDIELVTASEREEILRQFNDTACEYPQNQLLQQWFELQTKNKPELAAVLCGNSRMTYGELDAKANQLAHLLQARGLGPNRIAAIAAERSPEMIVGILAILKAGGAYLPIAPDLPAERIHYMLEDSKAQLLLTQKQWIPAAEGWMKPVTDVLQAAGTIIDLNDEANYQGDDAPLPPQSGSSDLAYVIYTSGSTGKPKGVMIEHRAVVNRIHWMQKKYPLTSGDVILHKTAFTFDVSVWELFWWSAAGAAVSLLEPGGEKNPESIIQAVADHQVTVMHFVPSMLHVFLDYVELSTEQASLKEGLSSLRYVFASGEALAVQQVSRFDRQLGSISSTQLINLYGPTEAAIDVSYYDCEAGLDRSSIPIGKPIDNIQLYILDKDNHLMPIGIPGELCIAGAGLARGYLHREELTAEKFVSNPFIPGTRMYRTGDLAKWLPDGSIEYIGRIDHQVKLRGYRIELGEIEAALLSCPAVAEAVVLVNQAADGDQRLCAYVTAKQALHVPELRTFLSRVLPEYMIPAHYTILEAMPLTSSGKVDRQALLKLEAHVGSNLEYAAPKNEVEAKLTEIWAELLGLDRVGTQDNFFDIGGNSLLLVRMHGKLQADYSSRIKVVDLFTYPTVEKLAIFIQNEVLQEGSGAEIRYIELPSDFFADRREQQARAFLKLPLDTELSQQLISIGKELQTDLQPILASIYLYLFAQFNKKSEQSTQLMLEDRKIHALSLDFSAIRDVRTLVQTMRLSMQESLAQEAWITPMNRSTKPPLNGIAAFFYNKSFYIASKNVIESFDLALAYEVEHDQIVLSCEFNGRRLRKEKIKQWVLGYEKLARWFANQYISQSQTATT
jgi:fengycin family lipopeptide synthetase D